MAFLLRVFSRGREAPQQVEDLRKEFLLKKHEISQALLQNAEVSAFVEMIFDNSDQETKLFLSSPSHSSLKEHEDVVSKILLGLNLQDAWLFGRLTSVIQEHGVETVSDIVIRVLKLLSHLLVNKHITLDDDLPESLDYAWQLSSPLSRKPKVSFKIRQQSISRQELQPASPFQEHDGTKKIIHCMEEAPQVSNNDNVRGQEQEPEPVKEAQNIPAPVAERESGAEQTQSCAEKQEEPVEVSSTGLQLIMKMGALSPISNVNGSTTPSGLAERPDEVERNPSMNHSSRMSYGGSLYTTDSDDDSLSTSSHTSLLVAVSEAQDFSDSSSADGSDVLVLEAEHVEPVDVVCYSSSQAFKDEEPLKEEPENLIPSDGDLLEEYDQDGGDDSAEDKLPICSSVVLSRRNSCSEENDLSGGSFYTPEMWIFSDNDANDFESALGPNVEENASHLQSFDGIEKKTENLEEVKVVMETDFEDKYVSVSVHPVSMQSPAGDITKRSSEAGGLQEAGWKPEGEEQIAVVLDKVLVSNPLSEEEDGLNFTVPEKDPIVEMFDGEDDLVDLDISSDGKEKVVELDTTVPEVEDDGNCMMPEKLADMEGQDDTEVEEDGKLKVPEKHADIEKLVEQVELEAVQEDILMVPEKHTDIGKLAEQEGLLEKELDNADSIVSSVPPKADSGVSIEKDAEVSSEAAMRTLRDALLDTEETKTAAKDGAAAANDLSRQGTEPLLSSVIPLSGPIVYNGHSGAVPYSGSLSLRSDSSTTSTRSFAFPILSADWTSSPIKMAPPERSYPRHRRQSWRSLCCFCSVK